MLEEGATTPPNSPPPGAACGTADVPKIEEVCWDGGVGVENMEGCIKPPPVEVEVLPNSEVLGGELPNTDVVLPCCCV